ncbi:radical SAM/SPASM domain-containing protein [Candidatus Agathobaculum pullicola]|uniref:radical SAM/SPASM domain-containing protein n=1 Tax=Candidatus Agathobaculum pullicola TaxID=2838426 RepID=UPI003F8E5737
MERMETQHLRQNLSDVLPLAAPFTIYLDPCGVCNFQCAFCPCNNSDEHKEERHTIMEWSLFEKIVQELKKFNGTIKVINLYCFGEPLLNHRISDMVAVIKENHLCREVRITTNGSLLIPELSQKLIDAGIDLVRVSVEALNDEGYKTICKSPVSFQVIRQNIADFYRLSRATKSKISAKIVNASLKNEKDVKLFYQLFKDITDFHFIEEVESYWPEFHMENLPTDGVKAIQKCYLIGENRRICTFPFTDMVIHSNGNVVSCCVDWQSETKYGNAAKDSLYDLWFGSTLRTMQLKHLDRSAYYDTVCRYCDRKPIDNIDSAATTIRNRIEESHNAIKDEL